MPNSSSYNPGQYQLEDVILINNRGVEKSVLRQFSALDIQEDMFSTTLHGCIGIVDQNDFRQNFPLVGQEKLRLKFRTHTTMPWIELEFVIFEIANIFQTKEDESCYILNFCSPEFMRNNVVRVERAFTASPSEIAKAIISGELRSQKPFIQDNTSNVIRYTVTHERPFRAINHLLPRAISKENPGSSCFVFYESLDGYNFKNIEKMYTQDPIKYTWSVKNAVGDDIDKQFYSISNYEIQQNYDILSNTAKGTYGNKVEIFNPITRTVKPTGFDYFSDDYKKTEKLDQGERVLPESFEFNGVGRRKFVVGDRQNVAVRTSQLNQIIDSFKMLIEIPGNSQIRVGNILDLEFPSKTTFERNLQKYDELISGKYLVTSVRHIIDGGRYFCSLEVCKDSLRNKIEDIRREEYL